MGSFRQPVSRARCDHGHYGQLRLYDRAKVFVRQAGTIILAVTLVLWVGEHLPLVHTAAGALTVPGLADSVVSRDSRLKRGGGLSLPGCSQGRPGATRSRRPLAAAPTSTPAARLITRPSSVVSMVVLFGAAIALALAIRRRERGRRRDQEGAESA